MLQIILICLQLSAQREMPNTILPYLYRLYKLRLANHIHMDFEVERMEALFFKNKAQYDAFEERHAKHQVPVKDLATYQGKCFLGIDAGSTTKKQPSSVKKTELCYIPSTTTMTVIRSEQPLLRLKIFTVSFRKVSRLSTLVLPVTEKH